MGCTPSKPNKKAQRLTATNVRRNELQLQRSGNNHAIPARPHPVSRKNTLEEIIDPDDIPIGAHVRSPSGNFLNAQEFRERADRPPCIRERQERILQRTRTFTDLAEAARDQDRKSAEVCDIVDSKCNYANSFT